MFFSIAVVFLELSGHFIKISLNLIQPVIRQLFHWILASALICFHLPLS